MARDVALDLGTATTQVYARGQGLVNEEPTVAAVDRASGDVVDIGRAAIYLGERMPDSVDIVWPVRNGVIAESGVAQRFVVRLVKPFKGGFMDRLRLVIAVPTSASPLERRMAREAGKRAGASQVYLIEHVMAAALGADLPVHEPVGTMIVHVGAGVTEAALISLGHVVASSSVRSGSSDVDTAIKSMLRRDFGMIVTDRTAEDIKLAVSHMHLGEQVMIEASGEMAIDGTTMTAILERADVQAVLDAYLEASIEAVRATLVQAPPELAQDVITGGIHLAGGGALLGGLAARLANEFKVEVHVAPEPQHAVVFGAGKCLEAIEELRSLFIGEGN